MQRASVPPARSVQRASDENMPGDLWVKLTRPVAAWIPRAPEVEITTVHGVELPSATVGLAHVTVAAVACSFDATTVGPVLDEWAVSPLYDTVSVCLAARPVGVYRR